MAEYIEREALLRSICNSCDGWCENTACDCVNCKSEHRCDMVVEIAEFSAADVAPVPQEYAYFTTMDDENYLVDLTIPVSKSQYDAINSGKDLWSVLRMDGE